ncbi:MAG: porin family protein [candidate division Zixibacteria bacterium]|nr:porin family protein [candidate division Zixibacteria bacterium]MDH3937387.1 porin family protein [candidate division Zixibacteria bacterium]MDH4033336.1 porin family protein [candidate division Zixibacteria bacterium]
MKKLVMVTLGLLLMLQSASAAGLSAGVGAFGGVGIPVAQDDQSQGTVFGIRASVKAFSVISLEPHVTFLKYGDPDVDEIIDDPTGAKVNGFGVDARLGSLAGPGLSPFFFVGIGTYKVKNDDLQIDESNTGLSGGLGVEIGVGPSLGLEVRGRFDVIGTEGGGSKKAALITAGVNYHFGL